MSERRSRKSEVKSRESKAGVPKSQIRNPKASRKTHVKIAQKNILPTAKSKPQTETMEVHHHPQIEKKGLKEYFFEGLMIFLAVMMGYFA
ncbi:MAG: hypothetical protein M3N14_10415, partial [Bacteroidota bacterium]|nr:hypothetical protein [Bacteroidota bacterium]